MDLFIIFIHFQLRLLHDPIQLPEFLQHPLIIYFSLSVMLMLRLGQLQILAIIAPPRLELLDLFPKLLKRIRVLLRLEYLIKYLLQMARLRERPQTIILMTKNHIIQDRIRHTHQHRNLLIHLCTIFIYGDIPTRLVLALQQLLEFLELNPILAVLNLVGSHG